MAGACLCMAPSHRYLLHNVHCMCDAMLLWNFALSDVPHKRQEQRKRHALPMEEFIIPKDCIDDISLLVCSNGSVTPESSGTC